MEGTSDEKLKPLILIGLASPQLSVEYVKPMNEDKAMGKIEKKKYRYRKRVFLNEDYEASTFVVAIVEKSKKKKTSNCEGDSPGAKLIIENPYGLVTLDFKVDMPDEVDESLSKIRKFEVLLKNFRKAVEKGARLRRKMSYELIKDEIVK